MHIVTFIFVCIEIVIFFYLVIHRLARPDDKTTFQNIILILLLLTYNIAGGLLPDPNLPGSFFIQEIIAYASGFFTPCFFPYYVYKAFGLEKMRFHAFRGVFLCLMAPYLLFVIVFAASGSLKVAQSILALPVFYAIWVIVSLTKAIRYKYKNDFNSYESKEEVIVLFTSIAPWVSLPFIVYFELNQALETFITNGGFLLLLSLQVKRHIKELREEHQRLIDSEQRLLNWNTSLQKEVDRRTKELERINEQRTNTFVNLAHETKTPITLINNYLEEYIKVKGNSDELTVVKKSFDKLSNDIVNLFDLERFNKGFAIYNHNQIVNFSEVAKDSLFLFKQYANKKNIELNTTIEENIFIKADPDSICRIVNNLVENAIKYSNDGSKIEVTVQSIAEKFIIIVKDNGIGIAPEMHKKIFEPYYQIVNPKRSTQGMGLGLPIVKKVIQDLNGEIQLDSNPKKEPGTKISIILNKHTISENEVVSKGNCNNARLMNVEELNIKECSYDPKRSTILIVEDNISMVNYLLMKLEGCYNVVTALNGNEALIKIRNLPKLPDLIVSDIMMDKVDGYTFAQIISSDPDYCHIPFIFLSAKSAKADKLQGLKLGAIDFIQKPFSIQELTQKIESIIAHSDKQKKAALHSALNALNRLEGLHAHPPVAGRFEKNCQFYNLTCREKDIAKLILKGTKYKDIGEELFISERTVTKHVQNIFEKVRVTNKVELMNKLEA